MRKIEKKWRKKSKINEKKSRIIEKIASSKRKTQGIVLRISEKIDRERKKKKPINWSFVFIFTRAAVGVAGQIDHKRQNVMDSGRLFSLGTCTSQPVDALRANDCDDRFCMEIILIFIDEEDSSIFPTYLLSSPVHWMHHCCCHCSIAPSFFYHIFFLFHLTCAVLRCKRFWMIFIVIIYSQGFWCVQQHHSTKRYAAVGRYIIIMHFCFYSLFSIFFTFCGYLLFRIRKNAPKTGYWISAFEKIIQSVFFFKQKKKFRCKHTKRRVRVQKIHFSWMNPFSRLFFLRFFFLNP